MPPPLYLVQAARDLVFPILFFFALYFLGSRVDAFRGHSSLVALLIAGCAAATILGIAAQDLVSYGFYFASFFSYDLLLNVVFGGVYAAFLGFSAVYISNIRDQSSHAPMLAVPEIQDTAPIS